MEESGKNKLREWLDDHIDDYVEVPDSDGLPVYSVDTNKMANDLIEFIKENRIV